MEFCSCCRSKASSTRRTGCASGVDRVRSHSHSERGVQITATWSNLSARGQKNVPVMEKSPPAHEVVDVFARHCGVALHGGRLCRSTVLQRRLGDPSTTAVRSIGAQGAHRGPAQRRRRPAVRVVLLIHGAPHHIQLRRAELGASALFVLANPTYLGPVSLQRAGRSHRARFCKVPKATVAQDVRGIRQCDGSVDRAVIDEQVPSFRRGAQPAHVLQGHVMDYQCPNVDGKHSFGIHLVRNILCT